MRKEAYVNTEELTVITMIQLERMSKDGRKRNRDAFKNREWKGTKAPAVKILGHIPSGSRWKGDQVVDRTEKRADIWLKRGDDGGVHIY